MDKKIEEVDKYKYMLRTCPECGRVRKILVSRQNTNATGLCRQCANKYTNKARGSKHYNWQGGRSYNWGGYVSVVVDKDSPFISMANKDDYILEHRLIMAQHLGRCLDRWEIVHHLNGIRTDNRLENLAILDAKDHKRNTYTKLLQAQIRDMEAKQKETEKRAREKLIEEIERNATFHARELLLTDKDKAFLMVVRMDRWQAFKSSGK